ncbi:MAG: RnfH family protein [Alcanivoracaceae bacterium]|nr:RnfH family protein [Alcanivoracaceae bacterium]
MSEMIGIEVVYALPEKQKLLSLKVAAGTTMFEAARQSGITEFFPNLDLSVASMGVYGKVEGNPRQREMHDGERVEIYRPLTADPKENRKARAQRAKQRKAE